MAHKHKCEHCNQTCGERYTVSNSGTLLHVCKPCISIFKPPIRSNNASCRKYGHVWEVTTSASARKCSRQDCAAVEMQKSGEWVRVDVEPTKRQKRVKQQAGTNLYDMFGGMEVKTGVQTAKEVRDFWL